MIQIGTYNYLNVKHTSAEELILSDGEQEVLLSNHNLAREVDLDEELLVFVYHHKDGHLIATTKRPYACAGDFAFLKVSDVKEKGALVDFGIEHDLFIPSNQQEQPLEKGKKYVVYVYLDKHESKLTASTWLEDHVDTDLNDLEEGDEVDLLICEESDLGYSAIINNKYIGLLYRDEVYEELGVGESRLAYIKKIRKENNKIDLSLRPLGFDFILDSKDVLLDILKQNEGILNLGDKSPPEEIRARLKMSKKAFKQVIGGLYKERLITISDHELRLVTQEQEPE